MKGGTMNRMAMVAVVAILAGCKVAPTGPPVSDTGVKKASAKVATGSDGLTVEQRNVKARIERDNKPGSVKHLYVFSNFSANVMLYSTVSGKVTSSGKRLTSPVHLADGDRGEWRGHFVMPRIQDDGTYGSSIPYLYWFDTKDVYHQLYITGGQTMIVREQPLALPDGMLLLDLTGAES